MYILNIVYFPAIECIWGMHMKIQTKILFNKYVNLPKILKTVSSNLKTFFKRIRSIYSRNE